MLEVCGGGRERLGVVQVEVTGGACLRMGVVGEDPGGEWDFLDLLGSGFGELTTLGPNGIGDTWHLSLSSLQQLIDPGGFSFPLQHSFSFSMLPVLVGYKGYKY